MDSKLFSLHTIEIFWNKIKNKCYIKPVNGIPKSDLNTTVQSSLSKADTALQKHQDISGKQDKLTAGTNITISGNTISAKDTTYTSKSAVSGGTDVSLVTTGEKAIWNAKTSNVGTITGIKMNGASKGTSGVVDLGTVITAHQDISGKQDKSTAVTHSANTSVGSATKPVYVAANGAATPISHSINSDVPANAKFTDTTYSDATQSTHGLMTAADKKKLDGMDLTKYLPKSGGVMTGDIDMQTNKKDILVGTHKANVSDGTAVAGGIIEKHANMTSTLPETRSFIGSFHNTDNDKFYNLISVRHRNGCTDGNAYGMYLYSVLTSNDSLRWNKQISANNWQGDRVLLDDVNFTNYALAKDGTAEKAKAMSDGTLRSGFYVNAATNATTGHVWFRMATCKISGAYETVNTTFLITNGMVGHALLSCGVRNDGTGKVVESCSLNFSARNGSTAIPSGMFRVVAINGSTGVTYELWGQITARWQGVRYTVLDERNISGGKYNSWKLENHSDADAKTAPTNGDYFSNSVDISACATAAKATEATTLTDSGWIIPTFPSGIKNSTIRYRKQGKIVSVSGYVIFSESASAKVVLTLPEGYRPPAKIQQFNAVDSSAQASFLTTIDTNGKVSFVGKTQGFFDTKSSYYIHCTFFVD